MEIFGYVLLAILLGWFLFLQLTGFNTAPFDFVDKKISNAANPVFFAFALELARE